MTDRLLNDYASDPSILDNIEIMVLPIFNPDGYSYTWTGDRMWRKTRSPNPGSSCVGTDPNRNWNFHWCETGASTNPCSESYCGSKAFSEVEVKSVADYLATIPNLKGYINFHSYGELWMSPWGYTTALPRDFTIQNQLSKECSSAIQNIHGIQYRIGTIANTIYEASGSSADWTYGTLSVLYSYGVELRDTGRFGFLLPASEIIPTGEETYEAIKVVAKKIIDLK